MNRGNQMNMGGGMNENFNEFFSAMGSFMRNFNFDSGKLMIKILFFFFLNYD